MKRILFIIIATVCIYNLVIPQNRNCFKYQAVIRNDQGDILANQSISLKINILQGTETGSEVYSEVHKIVTNDFGLVVLNIGNGTTVTGSYNEIDWGGDAYFLQLELDRNGGDEYQVMGTSPLLSVPYSLHAESVSNLDKFGIEGNSNIGIDEALFAVINSNGDTVFAVYQEGVRVYVSEDESKGLGTRSKGGFAIGALGASDVAKNEFFRVTADSVRVYIKENSASESKSKGGFAVGTLNSDLEVAENYMYLERENYLIGHNAGNSIMTGKFNSFFGFEAGLSNIEGSRNIFIGYKSGMSNLSGFNNIFIGDSSGFSNTSGIKNVMIGDNSGKSNTTGYYNVFIGDQSGKFNIDGTANVFIGVVAGKNNISGSGNVFCGNIAGVGNTYGAQNVFLGAHAGRLNSTGSNNIFLGSKSGYNNGEANENIFIGVNSGFTNTLGSKNIFMGYNSGYSNIDGWENVFLGDSAGFFNETGWHNIFIGTNTGRDNVSGAKNICLGSMAGRGLVSGWNNMFLGELAGGNTTTGNSNIFCGNYAGRRNTEGSENIFLGKLSGYKNLTGTNNIFVGNESGYSNTIATNNIFLGYQSGYSNTEGYENVFIGNASGHSNTLGQGNTMIGGVTGWHNTEGIRNTFLGIHSGNLNITGNENVFIGAAAGHGNETGSYNVLIGPGAGHWGTNGSYNVFIGNAAGYNEMGSGKLYIENSANDSTGALIYGDFESDLLRFNAKVGIGANPEGSEELFIYDSLSSASIRLRGLGDNRNYSRIILESDESIPTFWRMGHSKTNALEYTYYDGVSYSPKLSLNSNGNLFLTGDFVPSATDNYSLGADTLAWLNIYTTNAVIETSDARLKENIKTLDYGLNEVLKLNPVSFNWKNNSGGSGRNIGLIAQEVQQVIEEAVNVGNNEDQTLGIKYSELIPVLIKGMQEQQNEIEALRAQVDELKKMISDK